MTKQEYYDLLCVSALDGTFPSTIYPNGGGICRYRSNDGRKCAIGILIPDEKYSPQIENSAVNRIEGSIWRIGRILIYDLIDPIEGLEGIDFYECQRTHDCNSKFEPFIDNFYKDLNLLPFFSDVKKIAGVPQP